MSSPSRKRVAIGSTDNSRKSLCAMEADQQHPITVLAVVEGRKCIGVIKMHDILQSGI